MPRKNLIIILFGSWLAFAVMYVPQPLLPLFADHFGVSAEDTVLLISVTLLPLGIAPVLYGYIIETVPARTLLRVSFAVLILTEAACYFVDNFWALVAIRLLQGLVLPGIFTSLMTYCSSMTEPAQVRRVMSFYIATTIFGGFSGRALSGVIATYTDWHIVFAVWTLLLIAGWLALISLDVDKRASFDRIGWGAVRDIVSKPAYARAYALIFVVFFAFTSVLNFLPFRIKELNPAASEALIASVYLGYLIGVLIALGSGRLNRVFGDETRSIMVGLGCFALGVVSLLAPSMAILFAGMLVLSCGFFLIHTVISGFVNHHADQRKGVVNGLYVSFYYMGGAAGSYLPAFVYRDFGWQTYVLTVAVVLCLGLWLALSLQRVAAVAPGYSTD